VSKRKSPTAQNKSPKQRPAWVIERVRKLLESVKKELPLQDGKPQTWPGICEAITDTTGVLIPHERLRQFVEGIRDQASGSVSHPTLRSDRIEAVIAWATDADDLLIAPEELERELFITRAPLCLSELIAPAGEPFAPPPKVIGSFAATRAVGESLDVFTLTFEPFSSPGVWHVQERHFRYAEEEWHLARIEGRKPSPEASLTSTGWSLLSGEDQLLIFMKESRQGINHRWLLLGHADFWSEEDLRRMTFLRQDYPYDSVMGDDIAAALASQMRSDILTFERTGDDNQTA
jgi:hypothetical protein